MKEFLLTMLFVALGVGFIVWIAGQPKEDLTLFENNTVLCRRWDTEWTLGNYKNRECYKLVEIQ